MHTWFVLWTAAPTRTTCTPQLVVGLITGAMIKLAVGTKALHYRLIYENPVLCHIYGSSTKSHRKPLIIFGVGLAVTETVMMIAWLLNPATAVTSAVRNMPKSQPDVADKAVTADKPDRKTSMGVASYTASELGDGELCMLEHTNVVAAALAPVHVRSAGWAAPWRLCEIEVAEYQYLTVMALDGTATYYGLPYRSFATDGKAWIVTVTFKLGTVLEIQARDAENMNEWLRVLDVGPDIGGVFKTSTVGRTEGAAVNKARYEP
ncbi:hypothetical protein AMAG_18376 [Allomyces macrogynus ATCC 38327]|uniref:Uncharacterized protein n=1 Tax=Allomyces macrogynus (strain ATCC 38327) TaxID=578462 RepID=A0A0L0S6S2_ALLM3|nr:hypothetical protein AMAG_18376 [Allomyces macrogynus ATCC 38327]|eukprot:KNE58125.1 hypothetical protein AMAG_18376 [Allomyces macrogynus ATCC 38327]